jgi:PTS system fructose-specific IIA component
MNENKIITPSLIFLDEGAKTKQEVIKQIACKAKEINYIKDVKIFYDSVMKREEEVPTAIGYNIAIPHGKTDTVIQPFIAFYRNSFPFRWTNESEEMVQLIFQIGVPETGTEKLHLKFISEVSKKLLDEDFIKQLESINDKNSVYEILNSIEV